MSDTGLDWAARARFYRDALLDDCVPFWLRHAPDREHGGWFFSLDHDGTVLDRDKPIWITARFTWLLATLAQDAELVAQVGGQGATEWRREAARGIAFLREHGFDASGKMYFLVEAAGAPLRMRRYAFSEAFAAIAFAAWSGLEGDLRAREQAMECAQRFRDHARDASVPAKVDPSTRAQIGLAQPMMEIAVGQALRAALPGDADLVQQAEEIIDAAIEQLLSCFVHPELEAVLEVVAPDGAPIDSWDGRTLNPGHAIEAAWFLMDEARMRAAQDPERSAAWLKQGQDILDWSWQRGWDREHGGLLYFVDLHGGPVQEYWHDMKFWWPHNEAVIATLLAYEQTGEAHFLERYQRVHDWAHAHFADPECGEWFGYLHRDGTRSNTLKGGHWKGPFHLPRMQLWGWRICQRLAAR